MMTNSDNGGRLAHEIELGFAAPMGCHTTAVTPAGREDESQSNFNDYRSMGILGRIVLHESIKVELILRLDQLLR